MDGKRGMVLSGAVVMLFLISSFYVPFGEVSSPASGQMDLEKNTGVRYVPVKSDDRSVEERVADMPGLPADLTLQSVNEMCLFPTYKKVGRAMNTRADGDVEVSNIQFSVVNSGLANQLDNPNFPGIQASIGTAVVGKSTTITVTVHNNGSTPVTNIAVKLSIEDAFEDEVFNDTIGNVASLAPDGTQDVTYTWTPGYSNQFIVRPYVVAAGDPNPANDWLKLWDYAINPQTGQPTTQKEYYDPWIWVMKWAYSLEDSDSANDRIVDAQSDMSDTTWHVTESAGVWQNNNTHTTTKSLYCGDEGVTGQTDHFNPDTHASVVVGPFDLSKMNMDFAFYTGLGFNAVGKTAATEANDDYLKWPEVSIDGGSTWMSMEEAFGSQPDVFVSGNDLALDWTALLYRVGYLGYTSNWDTFKDGDKSNVYFRITFISDSDANTAQPGYYLDDFFVVSIEVSHDMAVDQITYGTNIARPGDSAQFKVKVVNQGFQDESSVNINLTIFPGLITDDVRETTVEPVYTGNEVQASLASGATAEKTFTWSIPEDAEPGVYTCWANTTVSRDMVLGNNDLVFIFYVSGADQGSLLYVNDGYINIWQSRDLLRAVENASLTYDIYNMLPTEDGPGKSTLDMYDMVIWHVGTSLKTLTSADQSTIQNYLAGGGKLWLIGDDILYDLLNNENGPVSGWASSTLHVSDVYHDVGLPNPLKGVGGDPITHGMNLTINGDGGWADDITPASGAHGIFESNHNNEKAHNYSAIRYAGSGGSKLVFFAFDVIYLADGMEITTLVENIYAWMIGGVEWIADTTAAQVDPSATEPFKVTLKNKGAEEDTVTITVNAPAGYTVDVPSSVTLSPGEEKEIWVNVTAPEASSTTAGQTDDIVITATSGNSGKSVDLTLNITINAYKEITFSASSTEKSGDPGDEVTFTVTVKNNGNSPGTSENVALTVDGDVSWASVDSESFSLDNQTTKDVTVTVAIPSDPSVAKADTYEFALIAKIAGETKQWTQDLKVTVNKVSGVELSTDNPETTVDLSTKDDPAQNVSKEFSVTVKNTGNAEDTYDLAITGVSWDYAIKKSDGTKTTQLTLAAGMSETITVVLYVPQNANAGKSTVTLTASSGGATASLSLNVTVQRPDLSVESVNVSKSKVKVGSSVSVSFTVKNTGNKDVNSAEVQVFLMKGDLEVDNVTVTVSNIKAGGSATGEATLKAKKDGTLTVKVVVDPSNKLKESSETNNNGESTLKAEKEEKGSPGFEAVVVALSVLAALGVAAMRRRD